LGYAVEENMETESMIEAQKMVLIERKNPLTETIHYTDRGDNTLVKNLWLLWLKKYKVEHDRKCGPL